MLKIIVGQVDVMIGALQSGTISDTLLEDLASIEASFYAICTEIKAETGVDCREPFDRSKLPARHTRTQTTIGNSGPRTGPAMDGDTTSEQAPASTRLPLNIPGTAPGVRPPDVR